MFSLFSKGCNSICKNSSSPIISFSKNYSRLPHFAKGKTITINLNNFNIHNKITRFASSSSQIQARGCAVTMAISLTHEEQVKITELKLALEGYIHANNTVIGNAIKVELNRFATDPHLLFKYLRGRKLKVDKAYETILKYAEVKCVIFPECFPNQVPSYVSQVIFGRLINLLSNKDEFGRTYIFLDTTKWDDSVVSEEQCSNTLRYIIEALMNSPDFLDNGVIIIQNANGLLIRHSKNAGRSTKFHPTFWKILPVRFNKWVLFSARIYCRGFFTMAKPLLKSKTVERTYMSSGLTELHKRVPLNILPKSMGGMVADAVAFVPPDELLAIALGK